MYSEQTWNKDAQWFVYESQLSKEALSEQDTKSKAILALKSNIDSDKKELADYKNELIKVNNLIVGILVFVSVSFLITIFVMLQNNIKDKDIELQYIAMYNHYLDRLNNVNQTDIEQNYQIYKLQSNVDILNQNIKLKSN